MCVNGVNVGGMTKKDACTLVRGEIERGIEENPLKIYGEENEYTLTYPQITFSDNLEKLLKRVKKGQKYMANVEYNLRDIDEIATGICRNEYLLPTNSSFKFNAEGAPFSYKNGTFGRWASEGELKEDIKYSLCHNLSPINIVYHPIAPAISLDEVKNNTRLIGTFSTNFDSENVNRAYNICLAAKALNGTILNSGKVLSFNDTVGERTQERGFKQAKIIERGEYVEGVGGGVCQVSTTLYNCALLSGLEIVEYHPHTLAVSYVPPSRDAMVSGRAFDLKIKNNFNFPIFIRSKCEKGSVTFFICGRDEGLRFNFVTNILGSIPPEEECTSDPALARDGREGVLSEGYIVYECNGEKIKKLIRKDKYKAIKKVVLIEGENP